MKKLNTKKRQVGKKARGKRPMTLPEVLNVAVMTRKAVLELIRETAGVAARSRSESKLLDACEDLRTLLSGLDNADGACKLMESAIAAEVIDG